MLQPDLIFRNARIIDGTGSPSTTGDLAVSGDRLLDLGVIGNLHGEQEIDIEGRKTFLSSGGRKFTYIPCLNDTHEGMELLHKLTMNELAGWI